MSWWNKSYFDRRTWILDHFETLGLSMEEGLLLLMIDYFNEQNMVLSHNSLSLKMNMDMEYIDRLLNSLSDKGYLDYEFENGSMKFVIDGVFDHKEPKNDAFNTNLFELFESEFSRPLSQVETQSISDLLQSYDKDMIILALREAMLYEVKQVKYVESVLMSWKQKGYSSEDVKNGAR